MEADAESTTLNNRKQWRSIKPTRGWTDFQNVRRYWFTREEVAFRVGFQQSSDLNEKSKISLAKKKKLLVCQHFSVSIDDPVCLNWNTGNFSWQFTSPYSQPRANSSPMQFSWKLDRQFRGYQPTKSVKRCRVFKILRLKSSQMSRVPPSLVTLAFETQSKR